MTGELGPGVRRRLRVSKSTLRFTDAVPALMHN